MTDLTIAELGAAIAERRVSPREVLEGYLARIEREDGRIHSYITVLSGEARAEARAAEERAAAGRRLGPLDGVPIAIKDAIAVRGAPTTAGSRILANFVPDKDAHCVARLRAAGAVLIGKTNLHEFAYGVTSDNPHFGAVLNPLDPERIPGGSSGGSAAAVAAGLAAGAVGTDTGGSIRIPAAACGLVGFKPTYGVVSCAGVVPQAWSLDHVGPITRSVADAALLLSGLTGCDWAVGSASLANLRIGVPASLVEAAAPSVRAAFDEALAALEAEGASQRPVEFCDLETARRAWLTIILAESAAYHRRHLAREAAAIGKDVRPFLLAGALIRADDYLDAQRRRGVWLRWAMAEFANVDVIATPTLPTEPPRRGAEQVETGLGRMSVRDAMVFYQWPANLLGWPCIALPIPRPAGGLPASLLLMARPGMDERLLAVAYRCETVLANARR